MSAYIMRNLSLLTQCLLTQVLSHITLAWTPICGQVHKPDWSTTPPKWPWYNSFDSLHKHNSSTAQGCDSSLQQLESAGFGSVQWCSNTITGTFWSALLDMDFISRCPCCGLSFELGGIIMLFPGPCFIPRLRQRPKNCFYESAVELSALNTGHQKH